MRTWSSCLLRGLSDRSPHTYLLWDRNLFCSCRGIGPTMIVVQRADIPDAFEDLDVEAVDVRALAKW